MRHKICNHCGGGPPCLKFIPCDTCPQDLPCAIEFSCDTFKPQVYNAGTNQWAEDTNDENKRLDHDGQDIVLTIPADLVADPPTPKTYLVEFDPVYLEEISAVFGLKEDGTKETCTSLVLEKGGEPELTPDGESVTGRRLSQKVCGYFMIEPCAERPCADLNPDADCPRTEACPWPFKATGTSSSSGINYEITRDQDSTNYTCHKVKTICSSPVEEPHCADETDSCARNINTFGLGTDLGSNADGVPYYWPEKISITISSLTYTSETETDDCNIPQMDCSKAMFYDDARGGGGTLCSSERPSFGDDQNYIATHLPGGSDVIYPAAMPDGFQGRGVRCKVDMELGQCNQTSNDTGKLGTSEGFSMCSPFALFETKQTVTTTSSELSNNPPIKTWRENCWFKGDGESQIINITKMKSREQTLVLTVPEWQRTNPRFAEYFPNVDVVGEPTSGDTGGGGPGGNTGGTVAIPYASNRTEGMRVPLGWIIEDQEYEFYYVCSRRNRLKSYLLWLCDNSEPCFCLNNYCSDPSSPHSFCNDGSCPAGAAYPVQCAECIFLANRYCLDGTGDSGDGPCPDTDNEGAACVELAGKSGITHDNDPLGDFPSYDGYAKDLYVRIKLSCNPEETHYENVVGGITSQGSIKAELTLYSRRSIDLDINESVSEDSNNGWIPLAGDIPCEDKQGNFIPSCAPNLQDYRYSSNVVTNASPYIVRPSDWWRYGCDFIHVNPAFQGLRTPGTLTDLDPMQALRGKFCGGNTTSERDPFGIVEPCWNNCSPDNDCGNQGEQSGEFDENNQCFDNNIRDRFVNPGDRLAGLLGVMDIATTTEYSILNEAGAQPLHAHGFNQYRIGMYNVLGNGDWGGFTNGADFPASQELIEAVGPGTNGINNGRITLNRAGLRATTMQEGRPCDGWQTLVDRLNYPRTPEGQDIFRYGLESESYPLGKGTDRLDDSGNPLPHCTYSDLHIYVSGGPATKIQQDNAQSSNGQHDTFERTRRLSYIFTKECSGNWYSVDAGSVYHNANGCAKRPALEGGDIGITFFQ